MFDCITADMCMGVFDEVKNLIPTIAPAVIAFMAFRKGFQFFRSAIKGA